MTLIIIGLKITFCRGFLREQYPNVHTFARNQPKKWLKSEKRETNNTKGVVALSLSTRLDANHHQDELVGNCLPFCFGNPFPLLSQGNILFLGDCITSL